MQKTRIEWTDYTSNPVKGYCPMACSYCYARAMYDRFGWDKTIRFEAYEIFKAHKIETPSRIFVGSTIELFGDWIPDEWLRDIFDDVKKFPQHTFQFLTKCPQNLPKWNPWPDNAWVGVSCTNRKQLLEARRVYSSSIIQGGIWAKVKFISFEPLLDNAVCNHEWETRKPKHKSPLADSNYCRKCGRGRSWDTNSDLAGVDWLIIGAQTQPYRPPKTEWIREILEAADTAGIPVFLKDNLYMIKPKRQEFPI